MRPWATVQAGQEGREILERQLTPEAVRWVLRRRCRQAGIDPPAAPHDLRRTNIGELLELTGDLAAVQNLAGHADPATTGGYDRTPEAARRRVARSLHVPYVPPAG
jgi:site-specific recombinase XerD